MVKWWFFHGYLSQKQHTFRILEKLLGCQNGCHLGPEALKSGFLKRLFRVSCFHGQKAEHSQGLRHKKTEAWTVEYGDQSGGFSPGENGGGYGGNGGDGKTEDYQDDGGDGGDDGDDYILSEGFLG